MLTLLDLLFALELAALGCVFSLILIEEDQIFEWWGDILIWLINHGLKYLAYPLGNCEKCFSGQLALWIWLFYSWESYKVNIWHALIQHVLFISSTIFFTIPIKQLITWTKNKN